MAITQYTFNSIPVACAETYLLHDNQCKFLDPQYENCAIPIFTDTTTFTCAKCKPGFYLNSQKLCENNFEVTLPSNCQDLNEDNSCAHCNDNFSNIKFHSKQSIICDSNISIANCLLYDTASKGNCQICSNGYLSGDKTCEEIINAPASSLIDNCETYEYDRCKLCATGYVRTLDGTVCVDKTSLDSAKTDILAGIIVSTLNNS
jgi:hypothetical protein